MSIVNVKIIFIKKAKQTCKRPTKGRGATFFYNNGRFYTETDYSFETGYQSV